MGNHEGKRAGGDGRHRLPTEMTPVVRKHDVTIQPPTAHEEAPVESVTRKPGNNGSSVVRGERSEASATRRLLRASIEEKLAGTDQRPVQSARKRKVLRVLRIIKSAILLVLCTMAMIAWAGILLSRMIPPGEEWWGWLFFFAAGFGVILFGIDLHLVIVEEKEKARDGVA